jgi:hypothetical protein
MALPEEEHNRIAASSSGDHAGEDSPVVRIRGELDRIRASLDLVERDLDRLIESSPRVSARQRSDRYYRLLIEIYERGPHGVSTGELDELARRLGYDRRGLNGYFAGLRAPLRTQDGRAHLTLEGRDLVTDRLHHEVGT